MVNLEQCKRLSIQINASLVYLVDLHTLPKTCFRGRPAVSMASIISGLWSLIQIPKSTSLEYVMISHCLNQPEKEITTVNPQQKVL